jgi:hypothetical protein
MISRKHFDAVVGNYVDCSKTGTTTDSRSGPPFFVTCFACFSRFVFQTNFSLNLFYARGKNPCITRESNPGCAKRQFLKIFLLVMVNGTRVENEGFLDWVIINLYQCRFYIVENRRALFLLEFREGQQV